MLELAGIPMNFVRSKCPIQSASTPGTAAMRSTLARPSAVSIWGITIVRAWSAAIFATTSPPA